MDLRDMFIEAETRLIVTRLCRKFQIVVVVNNRGVWWPLVSGVDAFKKKCCCLRFQCINQEKKKYLPDRHAALQKVPGMYYSE